MGMNGQVCKVVWKVYHCFNHMNDDAGVQAGQKELGKIMNQLKGKSAIIMGADTGIGKDQYQNWTSSSRSNQGESIVGLMGSRPFGALQ